MRNRFDRQLVRLNDEMIEMGSMIEASIQKAIMALVNQDVEAAREVIETDEEINHQEKMIEALCLKLLLQQQPVARDLRVISSALKMITDMERIGDHASDISEIAIQLAGRPYIQDMENAKEMAKEASLMLVQSIEAFVNKDTAQAEAVILHDDKVDELFLAVKNDSIRLIHDNPDSGEQAADILMAAKYLERIGDHACNIAEWVIFSITGIHDKT